MLTTVENVKRVTNKDVTPELIYQAQIIIESFIGRTEANIDSANDQALLGNAVAFQSAYMLENYDSVYEQIAVRMLAQTDGNVVPDADMAAPFIAPMAIFAMRGLSWLRTRSVRTGKIYGDFEGRDGWAYN